MNLRLVLNGRPVEVESPPLRPLARVLRELGLTGTKVCCHEGRCGSCTVVVDDRTVVSCLYPAALADGSDVRTVEGLADCDELHPVQRAILDAGGVQCGICTPGMLMTLTSFLERAPAPTRDQVLEALAGNVCRCTGYGRIVEAALAAGGSAEGDRAP